MQDKPELKVELYSEAVLPTQYGEFLISVYRDNQSEDETILISKDLNPESTVFVRVHSECITGEVFGSLKCDCREQLSLALERIQEIGNGAVVYLRQEAEELDWAIKSKRMRCRMKAKIPLRQTIY